MNKHFAGGPRVFLLHFQNLVLDLEYTTEKEMDEKEKVSRLDVATVFDRTFATAK